MWRFYTFIAIILGIFWQAAAESLTNFPPTVHRCVWAGNKLRKQGDGSTPGSCSNCDPTIPECPSGCQDLIDTLYWSCAEVALPDGYYFDPVNSLQGSWEPNLDAMKVNVERCGSNNAFKGATVSVAAIIMALATAIYVGL